VSLVPSLEHIPALTPVGAGSARQPSWVTALLDLLLPPFCPVCHAQLGEGRRDPLCGSCWERLERIVGPHCRVCGLPFSHFVSGVGDHPGSRARLCGRCRQRLPRFSYARSATRYGEVARQALHAFKFGGRRALAAPLGDLLAGLRDTLPIQPPDLLVPVPLHPRRERERGFNQSWLLARRVARAWSVRGRADVLERIVATPPQTELSAEARRDNVRGAFAVRRPELVAGRHVVLVDDVFTTGSTATACALCLRKAGASVVGVLTVARAV
jgi:ComF family protein